MPIEDGSDADLKGTVLCIEDSPINMFLVETAIAAYPGVTLLKAGTGAEGIRLARAERPDLVLLDMHLPDVGGLEVVRALSEEATSGKLQVVLLTGDSVSMDILKALSRPTADAGPACAGAPVGALGRQMAPCSV